MNFFCIVVKNPFILFLFRPPFTFVFWQVSNASCLLVLAEKSLHTS